MDLKNVEDAQLFTDDKFSKQVLFQEGKTTAFVLNFMPGQTLPPHPHPNAHVYLHVVEGEGSCTIDGNAIKIKEKDVVHSSDQEVLSVENTGQDPLSIYVVLAKN